MNTNMQFSANDLLNLGDKIHTSDMRVLDAIERVEKAEALLEVKERKLAFESAARERLSSVWDSYAAKPRKEQAEARQEKAAGGEG